MKRPATDLLSLALGSFVNGLSAYAAVSLGTRTYGAAAFAPVSVLWTFWAASSAVLTFPIQHWIIRKLQMDGHDGGVRAGFRRLATTSVLVSAGAGAIAFVGRHVLFGDGSLVWPILVFLVSLGTATMGWTHGRLAGQKRFATVGTALAFENVIRLVAASAVVAWAGSVRVFGAALVFGPLVVLLWPSVFRFESETTGEAQLLGFVGGLGGGVLIAQLVLNSGPAVLAASGGLESDVTGLFVALALLRGPYLIALGVALRLTAPLADLVAKGRQAELRRIVTRGLIAVGSTAAVSAVTGFYGGRWLIDLLFGEGVSPAPATVAGLALGGVLALGTLLLTMVMVARAATSSVLRAWVLAVTISGLVFLVAPWPALTRVVGAFVIAEAVALGAMAVSELSSSSRHGSVGGPANPQR